MSMTRKEIVIKGIKARLEPLEEEHPGVMATFLDVALPQFQAIGVIPELTDVNFKLIRVVNREPWSLGLYWNSKYMDFSDMAREARDRGFSEEFLRFYGRVSVLAGYQNLQERLSSKLTGKKCLPLVLLLQNPEEWVAASEEFLNAIMPLHVS